MKFKKAVSAFAALTMAISVFASVGVNANAADTAATLTHTASYNADFGDGAGTLTVDQEKELIHMFNSTNYTAVAYAEFDLSNVPDNENIQSATLTYYAYNTEKNNRSVKLRYATDTTSVDLTSLTGVVLNLSDQIADAAAASMSADAPTRVEVDVKTVIETVLAKDKVIFAFGDYNNSGYIFGKGSQTYAPALKVTTTASAAATVSVSYKCGDTDLTASVPDTYDKSIGSFVGTSVTPNYPPIIEKDGKLYTYASGGDVHTVAAETDAIIINYTEGATIPAAKTTGNEQNYISLTSFEAAGASSNKNSSSNIEIGSKHYLECDVYVASGSMLDIRYGITPVGSNICFDAVNAENVCVKYLNTGSTYYNINTTDVKYKAGTWAHLKAVCDVVPNNNANPAKKAVMPIAVTITPSNGNTDWTDTFTNNREINGRNLKPGTTSSIKDFDGFQITGSGTAYIANMVTYAIPNPSITVVNNTTELGEISADIKIKAADGTDAGKIYGDLTGEGKTVKTIYAKLTSFAENAAPKIVIGGTEMASKWTANANGLYFAQFVGTDADFAEGGEFADVKVVCGDVEKVVWDVKAEEPAE